MPLIIISGGPATGKSLVAARIADELRAKHRKVVEIVHDDQSASFSRCDTFGDSTTVRFYANLLQSRNERIAATSAPSSSSTSPSRRWSCATR